MESRLRLFGAPQLECGGAVFPFVPERRFQLLAYLACANDWVSRERLAGVLFGDRAEHVARSNLRHVVMQVRRESIAGFEDRAGALRWQAATDVRDFERAIVAADWLAALDLYAGVFLDGFELGAPPAFADWLRRPRG